MPDREDLLRQLNEFELRVVGLLDQSASLIEAADVAQGIEDKRKAVLNGREMNSTVTKLKDDLLEFIKQLPRSDYPKHRKTLLRRYQAALDKSVNQD